MDAKTGYIPNQIPSSVFSSKPGGSMDWSLTSNKSIFSLHMGNVSLSRDHGTIGLAAALKSDETHKSEDGEIKGEDDGEKIKQEESNETVNQRTETNTVLSLPLVNESQYAESNNEDDESEIREMIKLINWKEHEDKETVEDDVMEIILDDSSICCRSDTSNNSISSFTFPILQNEGGRVKTQSMELRLNIFDKRFELSQPQPQTQPHPHPHPHQQFYFISATATKEVVVIETSD